MMIVDCMPSDIPHDQTFSKCKYSEKIHSLDLLNNSRTVAFIIIFFLREGDEINLQVERNAQGLIWILLNDFDHVRNLDCQQ